MKHFDTIGTIFGILGAVVIALNIGHNFMGYLFFTISTIFYIAWSYNINKNILILNSVFFIINIIGLINYF